jgi:Family of unknown function (DUF6152)
MRSTILLAMILAAVPAWAHHSFAAQFDQNKVVILQGTVTSMEWVNPHAYIHMAVKNRDGTVTNWAIEGNTPNSLLRVGITKKALAEGTEIAVRGYLSKSGDHIASGSSIVFKSGKKLALGAERTETKRATVLEWISSDEDLWKRQIEALKLDNSD